VILRVDLFQDVESISQINKTCLVDGLYLLVLTRFHAKLG
jgi:hypothetical protein